MMSALHQQQPGVGRGYPLMPGALQQQQLLRLPAAPGPGLTGLVPGFASGPGRPPSLPGAPAAAALQPHPQQQQEWSNQALGIWQPAAPAAPPLPAQQPQPPAAVAPAAAAAARVQQQPPQQAVPLPQGSAAGPALALPNSHTAATAAGPGPASAMANGHYSAAGNGSCAGAQAQPPPQPQQPPSSGAGDGPGPMLPLKEQLRHCGGFDAARQGDPFGAQHAKQLDNGAH